MPTAAEIERHIAEEADIDVLVEEDDGRFVVTGIVSTADEHDRAIELARDAAGEAEVDDGLEVLGTMPATIAGLVAEDSGFDAVDRDLSEVETRAMDGAAEGFDEANLEPGDFAHGDHTTTDSWLAQGPTSAIDEDVVSEGDVVFVPPTDPVVARDPVTLRTRVVGGLSPTSMDDLGVARSALDGEPGDEAIADAIRRELLEDAATTGLDQVRVAVFQGVATLRGRVPFLEDAENAEEVASRVPGVIEVSEELDVDQMETRPGRR